MLTYDRPVSGFQKLDAPVSLDKQMAVEMPRELCRWDAKRESVICNSGSFQPQAVSQRRQSVNTQQSRQVMLFWALAQWQQPLVENLPCISLP